MIISDRSSPHSREGSALSLVSIQLLYLVGAQEGAAIGSITYTDADGSLKTETVASAKWEKEFITTADRVKIYSNEPPVSGSRLDQMTSMPLCTIFTSDIVTGVGYLGNQALDKPTMYCERGTGSEP